MDNKKLFQQIVTSFVLVAALAGCSGFQSSPSVALSAPTLIAERGDQEWDYVVLGDSIIGGLIQPYAEMIEKDLGIKVNVQDWSTGGDHSSWLLERLHKNSDLRKALQEADVITFEIPWNVVQKPWQTYEGTLPGGCGGADNQDCLRAAFATYQSDTEGIIAEIVSLRSPCQALIRAMDTYQFRVNDSKAEGSFEVINRYWRAANQHVIETASRYGIRVARVYDAFMGKDGMEDPVDQGLVAGGFHATQEGWNLEAKLFRDLGYAYAPCER